MNAAINLLDKIEQMDGVINITKRQKYHKEENVVESNKEQETVES